MEQKTLAMFSVSAGAGHVRASEALKATSQANYPTIKAVHVDMMTLVPDLFKKLYADSYLKIVEHHPSFWGYLYKTSDRQKTDSGINKLRRAIERLNTRKLRETVQEIDPDVIICTHFLPAELFSRLIEKNSFKKPVWVVVTDFDIHSMWVHKNMNGYFAADEEVAWRMKDRGIDFSSIKVTGIPIMPVFGKEYDRKGCAEEIGVDPEKKTLLMMSGGAGLGGTEILAERLLAIDSDFQIIALAGKNESLLESLNRLKGRFPMRIFPLGFTKTIERIMAVSDIAITKSGGLTTSECLAMSLPMIVVSPIPGQEERNADFLLEHGVALKAFDAAGLEYRVKFLLDHPETLVEMRRRAGKIGKPNAAWDILRVVFQEN